MPIFKINNSRLEPISEKKIDLGCDIQKLTEQNLEISYIKINFKLEKKR